MIDTMTCRVLGAVSHFTAWPTDFNHSIPAPRSKASLRQVERGFLRRQRSLRTLIRYA